MSRILSLCTGYAGLDLAVEAVTGARTVAVSDVCKFDKKGQASHFEPHRGACKILAHRFPNIPNLGDLKNIDWAAWAGVEVMTAGYPCQPFSHAGKREGTDDPRHIFPYIADGIRIVGPRLVVLENVRGHLALGFDTVLGTLADIGYDARWVCVRASDVGAPHRRERLFIVATPADATGLRWYEGWTEPARLVGGLHAAKRGASSSADAGRGQLAGSAVQDDGLLIPAERGRFAAADAERGRRNRWARNTQRGPIERAAVAGSGEGDSHRVDWGQYAPAINRWAAALGRPAPAPTEPGAKGQPRLSPRFVEFMMGLPEGWVTDVPDLTRNEQLKALGNGVCPQQAMAALTFLLSPTEVAA